MTLTCRLSHCCQYHENRFTVDGSNPEKAYLFHSER